jgi:hypothetical protein
MVRIGASVLCATLFASLSFGTHIPHAPSHASLIEKRFHHGTYWLDAINHNGASPYNNDSSFVVYRNVMEYVHTWSNAVCQWMLIGLPALNMVPRVMALRMIMPLFKRLSSVRLPCNCYCV